MAKAKNTAFFCKECGYESAKWFGQCPACKEWNTFVEEPVSKPKSAKGIAGTSQRAAASSAPVPVEINSVSFEENDRTSTGIAELDRVLGGGIVSGSGRRIGSGFFSACRRRSWNRKVNTSASDVLQPVSSRKRCTLYIW